MVFINHSAPFVVMTPHISNFELFRDARHVISLLCLWLLPLVAKASDCNAALLLRYALPLCALLLCVTPLHDHNFSRDSTKPRTTPAGRTAGRYATPAALYLFIRTNYIINHGCASGEGMLMKS